MRTVCITGSAGGIGASTRARLEKDDLLEALAAEIIERKSLDLILDSAEYEDTSATTPAPEAPVVTTVEEQAVPGVMHDAAAPAAPAEGAGATP